MDTPATRPFNVLFLCTGNSARSIMAEALLNSLGRGRFHAFSAGSHPRGEVHPMAIDTLKRAGLAVNDLRSKSWDEFATADAPRIDFVFTVCDNAAKEVCPVWPGQPMTAHWGLEDPAAVTGREEDQRRAFNLAFRALEARLRIFTSLRTEALDRLSLQRELDRIGKLPVNKLGTFLVAAAMLFGATTTRAQEQAPDVRALAAAVADEQARIAMLQQELEQQSATLTELTRQLQSLAPPPPPPPPALPVPVPAATPPPFAFYGDAKVRYETLNQDYPGCIGCPDRKRGRLRLRLGADGRLAPDFRAVVGFGIGEINDPNTVYVNLGNNFSRKVATWDRGFVEYQPRKARWMDLTAGKFPYTWVRSSMTFDVDFYPEGLSERFDFDLRHAGALKNVGVQGFQLIVNEQPVDKHMTIVGTQLTTRVQPTPNLSTLVAVTGVGIQHPEFMLRDLLSGTDVGVKNTNAFVLLNGTPTFAGGFRYANVIVENDVRTPWPAFPISVTGEYQRNLLAPSNRDTAVSLRFDAGRAVQRGDWDFGWHIFRVEQDAILAGLGESDWRAPSNVLQQRIAVDRMVDPHVQLSFTLYRGRTLDPTLPGALLAPGLPPGIHEPWVNRFYWDVTYRY
jgi:arsenate reductase